MPDTHDDVTSSPDRKPNNIHKTKAWFASRPGWVRDRLDWCNSNRPLLVALIAIVVSVSFVVRIMFSSVQIGSPATESEALVRSSERLIQMMQWTISTVLIIGGGLIGLNWYSNEHRYREDKSILEQRLDLAEKRRIAEFTVMTEQSTTLHKQILEVKFDLYQLTGQISSSMMLLDGKMPSGGYVSGAIELLRKPLTTPLIKSRALEDVVGMFERESSATSFVIYIGLDSIPELAEEAEKQGFTEHAERLRWRYRELKSSAKDQL